MSHSNRLLSYAFLLLGASAATAQHSQVSAVAVQPTHPSEVWTVNRDNDSVAVIDATAGEVGSAAEVAVGVAVRLLAFSALVYLAVRLRQGRNSARLALAVLYGGFGALSLVIGPVTWLAEGGSLADATAAADLGSVLFAASRIVHLAAIITALILMFHPAANAYIRETRRTRAKRNSA